MKKKSDSYNAILIAAAVIVSIGVYNKLPEMIPSHWNIYGEVDGYTPKMFGAFLSPAIMLFTWAGMKFLPKLDPRKNNYEKFEKSYLITICGLITFFMVLHLVTLSAAMGASVSVEKIVPVIVGLIFVLIGNYLPKVKSNFFFGIKTPWTISNEVSWKKTHRLGGKLFVISGIAIILSSFMINGKIKGSIVLAAILVSSIIPMIASYFYAKSNRI